MDRSQRDQKVILDALMKVARRWNQNGERDTMQFPVIALSATSLMVAEVASWGTTLYERDGIEKVAAFMAGEFLKMLVNDLGEKIKVQGMQ